MKWPISAMADVYRQQAEDQMQQALGNVRGQQVLYQPGGGSRGDIFAAQAAATSQKALAQNLAGLYGGAYQQAMAGRMPAAQMGLGAQQFGMGYGLQGMQGAQAGAGMYPSLMQAPLGMYGAAQQIGAQQRALNQAAINRDIARYEYQMAQPQQALQSYLAGVTGDYGGMSQARGPGGGRCSRNTYSCPCWQSNRLGIGGILWRTHGGILEQDQNMELRNFMISLGNQMLLLQWTWLEYEPNKKEENLIGKIF